jgi:predicted CopG family antitoxin
MPKTKKSRGITTIQISTETKEELQKRGKKGDTYDDVIRELLKRRA